ncbi:methyl-accepting chemotaxis protein [Desulfobotulus sp. H1]|uniref:Methyl-accepting chemotaxis protein n=1 Tax=Desulfobotulus pelophilus TaxID=2823377 RepID=A0ABT3N7I0_9BACT|nr:methyl-accepting chemotaxis protein [Desulfobotulus pelophilus]
MSVVNVANIIKNIQNRIHTFARESESIAAQTRILSINATIEAARAGEAGKSFGVVAQEIRNLASQTASNSKELRRDVEELELVKGQFEQKENMRLAEMAQALVQLIVRNLYERTADVRWWATDGALHKCLEFPDRQAIADAAARLEVINRFYTVYLNLVLVNPDGEVLACSRPGDYPHMVGSNLSRRSWVKKALATTSGDQYAVEAVFRDQSYGNRLVAVYATAVRRGGQIGGKVVGALGVYFDWETQSDSIVRNEPNLTEEEWRRTRVLLLDHNRIIIASSDAKDLMATFRLNERSGDKGYYNEGGHVIAYAKTLGYEGYDGLGWYGTIVQKTEEQA